MQVEKIFQGEQFEIRAEFTDKETGEVIDLTGCTLDFSVKENLQDADGDAIHSDQITAFDSPTTGKQDLIITDEETDNFEPGTYFAAIRITTGAGKEYPFPVFKIQVTEKLFSS